MLSFIILILIIYFLFHGGLEPKIKKEDSGNNKGEPLTDLPSPTISEIIKLPGVSINYKFYHELRGRERHNFPSVSLNGVLHYDGYRKSVKRYSGWQQLAAEHALVLATNMTRTEEIAEKDYDINGQKIYVYRGATMEIPMGDDFMKSEGIGLAKEYSVPIEEVEYMLASTVFKIEDAQTKERYSIQMRDHIYEYLDLIDVFTSFSSGETQGSYFEKMIMTPKAAKAIKLFTQQSLSIESNRNEIVMLTHAVVEKIEV